MKALFVVALSVIAAPVHAEAVSGPATVADGDTLDVGGRKIRLFGIDAPELKQTCDLSGQSWACGEESARQLSELVGSQDVHCAGNEVDTYGRLLAVCTGPYGELNKLMVEHGWATAFRQYSQNYIAGELRARSGKQGLWAASHEARRHRP